jgi:hypothetical protein
MGVVLRREQSKPCPHATKEYSRVERICKQSFGYFGEHINPFAYIKRINCWWEHLSRHKFDYTRVGTDIPSPKRDIKATSASLQTTPIRRRSLYSKAVKPMKSYLELALIPTWILASPENRNLSMRENFGPSPWPFPEFASISPGAPPIQRFLARFTWGSICRQHSPNAWACGTVFLHEFPRC